MDQPHCGEGNGAFDEFKLRKLLTTQGDALESVAESAEYARHKGFFRFIIHFLTHLNLSDDEAKKHYKNILEHRRVMTDKLNRDVGLRVAAMDYFYNMVRVLSNPRIVEIPMFEEIEQRSREDAKTGCYNMNFFTEILDKEIRRAQRYDQQLSVLLIDIDNFKLFNDLYGHIYGDRILRDFCDVLRNGLRSEDAVARFGGDEFLVLMPQTGRVGARFMAERIRQKLVEFSQAKKAGEGVEDIRFSGGIATYPMDGGDARSLIQAADQSLYKAKIMGKDRIYDNLDKKSEDAVVSERRVATRYALASDTIVSIAKQPDKLAFQGRVLNISPTGILMECNCKISDQLLQDGFKIEIQKIGQAALGDLDLKADVAHVDVESEDIRFRLGLKFKKEIDSRKWEDIRRSGDLVIA